MVFSPCLEECIGRAIWLVLLDNFHQVLRREMRICLHELLQCMLCSAG